MVAPRRPRKKKLPEGPIEVGDFVKASHSGMRKEDVELKVLSIDGDTVRALDVKEQKFRAFALADCTLLRKAPPPVPVKKLSGDVVNITGLEPLIEDNAPVEALLRKPRPIRRKRGR